MKKIEHILNPPHGCRNCTKAICCSGLFYCGCTPADDRHKTGQGEWICDKYDPRPLMGFTEIAPEPGDWKNVKTSLRGAELRKAIGIEKTMTIKANYSNNKK